MRVERLTQDKVRFFLTFDDLSERGIEKEDLWRDIPKVHELFNDMMEQAYYELGFEVNGPVAIEVFSLPSQGLVVIVTRGRAQFEDGEDEIEDADTFELEVTLGESEQIVFAFRDFEHLVQAAHRIHHLLVDGGKLFHYQGYYILYLDELDLDMEEKDLNLLISVLAEYGDPVPVTEAVLSEYGKTIIPANAVKELILHFQ